MCVKKYIAVAAVLSLIFITKPGFTKEACYPLKIENWQERCFLELDNNYAVNQILLSQKPSSSDSISLSWLFGDRNLNRNEAGEDVYSLLRPDFRIDTNTSRS